MFSWEELEERESTILNKLVRTLESWLPLCGEESAEKLNWAIGRVKTKSQQPIQLTGSSPERMTSIRSPLAQQSSELGSSRPAFTHTSDSGEALESDLVGVLPATVMFSGRA